MSVIDSQKSICADLLFIELEAAVLAAFGPLDPITPQQPSKYFAALAESIIGQQLSTKVADVIAERVRESVGGSWSYQAVQNADLLSLRAAGLSHAKARYLKNVAEAFAHNERIYKTFEEKSDEEIIQLLTQIKGIGRWTVEMFLIFCMGRTDIFSLGDYGLRKAVSKVYNLDSTDKKAIEKIAARWQPERTYASRILWKSLELN